MLKDKQSRAVESFPTLQHGPWQIRAPGSGGLESSAHNASDDTERGKANEKMIGQAFYAEAEDELTQIEPQPLAQGSNCSVDSKTAEAYGRDIEADLPGSNPRRSSLPRLSAMPAFDGRKNCSTNAASYTHGCKCCKILDAAQSMTRRLFVN